MIIPGFGDDSKIFREVMQLNPCGHAFKPFPTEELIKKANTCLGKVNITSNEE